MSAFSGKQREDAGRIRRALKREEAEARNKLTLPENRRAYRRMSPEERLLFEVFAKEPA